MPDDLDPTTARLVSELASMILPSLTKSLASAIPAVDFSGAIERTNRASQDLRSEIVKALRSSADDSRAGRSIIMQSVGNVLEEISSVRKSLDRLPENISSSIKPADNQPVLNVLNDISARIDTLTQGVKAFFETYAENHESKSSDIPEILRPSIDTEALSRIEGLIRAESKSQSTALAELSREISALIHENSTALLHDVRDVVKDELSMYSDAEHAESEQGSGQKAGITGRSAKPAKLLFGSKFTAIISLANIIIIIINIIMYIIR